MAGRKVPCATPFWLCPIWAIFRDFQTLQIFETRYLCSVEMEEERIDSKPPTPIPAGQPISWNLLRIRFLGQLRSRFDPGKQSAQVLFPTLWNWADWLHQSLALRRRKRRLHDRNRFLDQHPFLLGFPDFGISQSEWWSSTSCSSKNWIDNLKNTTTSGSEPEQVFRWRNVVCNAPLWISAENVRWPHSQNVADFRKLLGSRDALLSLNLNCMVFFDHRKSYVCRFTSLLFSQRTFGTCQSTLPL